MDQARMKELPLVDRPREKLVKYGPEKLSNSELLAILLRTGREGENVVRMAERILRKIKTEHIPFTSFNELKNIHGLGPAKACEIVACFELGKRLLRDKKAKLILSPEDVWRSMRDIRDNKKEHVVVFYLDARQQEIKRYVVSIGTLTASLIHPREVYEPAVRNNAAHIILSHNHPSGITEPSEIDMSVTRRLLEAGKILGIELLDHVIVTDKNWFSLKENNLL